jgi:hypothetical protein
MSTKLIKERKIGTNQTDKLGKEIEECVIRTGKCEFDAEI